MRRETLLSHCLQKIHKKNSFSGQILLKTKETDRSESFELFTLFLLVPNPRKVNNFINVMAAKKISLLCISSLKEWTMPFSLLFYRVFISNRERRQDWHHEKFFPTKNRPNSSSSSSSSGRK